MSTTTNFKRIALLAVAVLGMGVLSSTPSQAVFSGTAGSQLTLTVANGTGSLSGSTSDTTTAGTIAVAGLALATGGLNVDAIPNEITTRIILNSSKSSILAQAINIGAKGVK